MKTWKRMWNEVESGDDKRGSFHLPSAHVAQAGWWFGVSVVPRALLALNL